MNFWLKNILCLILFTCAVGFSSAQVKVWSIPEKDAPYRSDDYEVSVREKDSQEWKRIDVLRCDVDLRRVQKASFAEFDMASPVVVRIKNHINNNFKKVEVRPHSRKLEVEMVNDSIVELELTKPDYLSIEFDGDRAHNLHLFANTLLTESHTPDEPQSICWETVNAHDVFVQNAKLIYFGPGVHRPKDLPSEEIKIPSNCTVYLAPGSVVKARLIVDRAENVRIVGRGILDHPLRGIEITYSKNVLVDGITVLNPAHYTVYGGQSENIEIYNLKAFSARPWSDGIDLMCCSNVKVENCFLRNSDDCIALYNHRWWFWGGSKNIDISRCSFWPDVAHPVNIGVHGDDRAEKGEILQNVRVHDCDILFGREQGLMAVQSGDQNEIYDVEFDSIRVEGIQKGRVFDLRIVFSDKYNRAPGHAIDRISFDHITVDPDTPDSCLMPSRVVDYGKYHVGRYTIGDIKIHDRQFDPAHDIVKEKPNTDYSN